MMSSDFEIWEDKNFFKWSWTTEKHGANCLLYDVS